MTRITSSMVVTPVAPLARPLTSSDAAVQIVGMVGLLLTIGRTFGRALRLMHGHIERHTTAPAGSIPMRTPTGAPAHHPLPATPPPPPAPHQPAPPPTRTRRRGLPARSPDGLTTPGSPTPQDRALRCTFDANPPRTFLPLPCFWTAAVAIQGIAKPQRLEDNAGGDGQETKER